MKKTGMPEIGPLKQQQVLFALISVSAIKYVTDRTESTRKLLGVRDKDECEDMINKSMDKHDKFLEITDQLGMYEPKINTVRNYSSRISSDDVRPVFITLINSTIFTEHVKPVWKQNSRVVLLHILSSIAGSSVTASVGYKNVYSDDLSIKPKLVTRFFIKISPRN